VTKVTDHPPHCAEYRDHGTSVRRPGREQAVIHGGVPPYREDTFLMSNEFDIIPCTNSDKNNRINSPRAGGSVIAFRSNN